MEKNFFHLGLHIAPEKIETDLVRYLGNKINQEKFNHEKHRPVDTSCKLNDFQKSM